MSRRLRVSLCVGMLVVGVVQVSVAYSRSLIPYRLNGTLTHIGWVTDTDGRLRTLTIGDDEYVIDNRRLLEARIGRAITKETWSNKLLLDGRKEIGLTVGDETFQFAALGVLALAGVLVLTRSSKRTMERRDDGTL